MNPHGDRSKRPAGGAGPQAGMALVTVILTLVVMGALAAAGVGLYSTAKLGVAGSSLVQQAYYLAESGYRYAASQYAAGADLDEMHDDTFSLDSSKSFVLEFFPYWAGVTSASGATLTAEVYFGEAPSLSGGGGTIVVGESSGDLLFTYNTATAASGSKVLTVTKSSGSFPGTLTTGAPLYFAAQAATQTVAENGDLVLQANTGGDVFPPYNGRFEAGGNVYRYRERDGDTLKGVRADYGETWANLSLSAGDTVKMLEFMHIESTGQVGSGSFGSNRLVNYYQPVTYSYSGTGSGGSGSGEDTFFNDAADLNNLDQASGQGWGSFAISDGKLSASASGGQGGGQRDTEAVTGIGYPDYEACWTAGGQLLSYDIQVKIKIDTDEPYYMAGFYTRLTNVGGGNMNAYGVSYMKSKKAVQGGGNVANELEFDNYPDALDDKPSLVFWRNYNGASKKYILAYKLLTNATWVVESNGALQDWSTLMVRLEEKATAAGDHYNEYKVYYTDDWRNSTVGNNNIYDQVRQSSPLGGYTDDAGNPFLSWPSLSNDDANDAFTLVSGWTVADADRVELDDYTNSTGGTVSDVILRTLDTPPGAQDDELTTEGWDATNFAGHPEIGLHARGDTTDDTLFDDLSYRCIGSGASGSGQGFYASVQD